MAELRFASKEHENFFYSMLKKCNNHDSYHRAFFYCVGISDTTRANVGRLFDFEQHHIRPEGLHEGWQTGGTVPFSLHKADAVARITDNSLSVKLFKSVSNCFRTGLFSAGLSGNMY